LSSASRPASRIARRPAPRMGNLWLTPPSYTCARQLASKSVAQPGASAIAIQFADPPPVRPPKIDDGHRALLTYQAMADSDDIVLILEYDGNTAANDAVIVASNA